MADEVLVRVRVDGADNADGDEKPHRAPGASRTRPTTARERASTDVREFVARDRARVEQRRTLRQQVLGRVGGELARRGGAPGAVAMQGLSLAQAGAARVGAGGLAAMAGRAIPVAAVAAGGAAAVGKLPGLILAAIEGSTGMPIPTEFADKIAKEIRDVFADTMAMLKSVGEQLEREKARIVAGGEADVYSANAERAAFAEVDSLRNQYREKLNDSIQRQIVKRLAGQASDAVSEATGADGADGGTNGGADGPGVNGLGLAAEIASPIETIQALFDDKSNLRRLIGPAMGG